jgi:hypothetical protein
LRLTGRYPRNHQKNGYSQKNCKKEPKRVGAPITFATQLHTYFAVAQTKRKVIAEINDSEHNLSSPKVISIYFCDMFISLTDNPSYKKMFTF